MLHSTIICQLFFAIIYRFQQLLLMLSKKSIILAKALNKLELGCKNFGWRLKTMQIYLLEIENYLFLLDHQQIEDYFLLLDHWQTINFLVFFLSLDKTMQIYLLEIENYIFLSDHQQIEDYFLLLDHWQTINFLVFFFIVRPLAD